MVGRCSGRHSAGIKHFSKIKMLAAIPAWVPALFLLLLALGYRQSRTLIQPPARLIGIAAGMMGFSLYGVVSAFGGTPVTVAAWLLGYGVALVAGASAISTTAMQRVGTLVRVPGSWVPLGLMMGIFAVKFALGYATAVHAAMLQDATVVAAVAAVLGAFSGGFGARALAVWRFARAAAGAGRGGAVGAIPGVAGA